MTDNTGMGSRGDRKARELYKSGVDYLERDDPEVQKAKECLEAAVKRGMVDACNYLAFIYGAHLGGPENEARAVEFYCKGGEAQPLQDTFRCDILPWRLTELNESNGGCSDYATYIDNSRLDSSCHKAPGQSDSEEPLGGAGCCAVQ